MSRPIIPTPLICCRRPASPRPDAFIWHCVAPSSVAARRSGLLRLISSTLDLAVLLFLWTLMGTLAESFVFPQLLFNAGEQNLWEGDPVGYVRISGLIREFGTPVSAATSFLFSLASNRTKTTFMPILGFIVSAAFLRFPIPFLLCHTLHTLAFVFSAPPSTLFFLFLSSLTSIFRRPRPQRFGALNMTAALGPWIMRHPDVGGNTEQFLLQFCDARVFERGGVYAGYCASAQSSAPSPKEGLQWSSDEHLNVTSRAVAAALDDPEFPVHAQAARTEMVLLHDSDDRVAESQEGYPGSAQDIGDFDILNRSMEVIVEAFQTELLPVAAQLTAGLVRPSSFFLWKLTLPCFSLLGCGSRRDDDKTNAAMGVAKTIGTIISATDSAPEISVHVQEAIIFISFTLKNKIFDSFDNMHMYNLVDSLTFKLRAISPNLWPVFELMYNLFEPNAADSLEGMLLSLDNFVSYGSDVVKTRPDYQRMLLDVYQTSITSEQLGENDPATAVNGCKLADNIILNLRGSVDDLFRPIIVTALSQLDKAETAALRLANLEVLINAVLYSPAAALHIMETTQVGFVRKFSDSWFAAISDHNKMPRVHDKKLSSWRSQSSLAAPLVSALNIVDVTGDFSIGGEITVTWTTSTSDPQLFHQSFNDNYAIANNVDASTLSKTMELPVVPTTDGDFYITFVDISDINSVFATSQTFTISLEGTPHSLTVQPSAGAPATTKSSSGSKAASSTTTRTSRSPRSLAVLHCRLRLQHRPVRRIQHRRIRRLRLGLRPSSSPTTGAAVSTRASLLLVALGVAAAAVAL
ncbi:hypothetical protein B0H14DRAFT_3512404 [Mycena olivaceomarginata]|nr:hypothetical protein B0H14DRAFT_3512404 [Mycena olivaceomarginata]